MTPDPLFAIGQPVILASDCQGTSLGIVQDRKWVCASVGVCFGFWSYQIRKANGFTYWEMEDILNGAKISAFYLRGSLRVVQ